MRGGKGGERVWRRCEAGRRGAEAEDGKLSWLSLSLWCMQDSREIVLLR